MSVIEAASVNVKTMADDTLRLTVDIEPRFADDAFGLFGKRGTPVALAALRIGAPAPAQAAAEAPAKGGELSKWVAIRCGEVEFQHWLVSAYRETWKLCPATDHAERIAQLVRVVAFVKSRAEIDNDPAATERFHRLIRGPYQKHLIAIGVTA